MQWCEILLAIVIGAIVVGGVVMYCIAGTFIGKIMTDIFEDDIKKGRK